MDPSLSTFANPPLELSKRSVVPTNGPRFEAIIKTLITEFNKKTLSYYCPKQHSIEKNSNKHLEHKECIHSTKSEIIGIIEKICV